jgi:hypothetical protein
VVEATGKEIEFTTDDNKILHADGSLRASRDGIRCARSWVALVVMTLIHGLTNDIFL